MWPIDHEALEFFVGAPVDMIEFLHQVNKDRKDANETWRIECYEGEKLWITGFCEFQYVELTPACIPHKKIILLLEKYKLIDRVPVRVQDTLPGRVQGTHKEKTIQEKKGIGKDKDKENTLGESENPLPEPGKKKKTRQASPELLQFDREEDAPKVTPKDYEAVKSAVKAADGDVPQMKRLLADFVNLRPEFLTPYLDIWNLSIKGTKLSRADTPSDARLQKIRTRLKEPAFDFVKILTEIKSSKYLRGEMESERKWKVDFDWIIENEKQYVRIIEGRYRNA
jgi:hypothetical protein